MKYRSTFSLMIAVLAFFLTTTAALAEEPEGNARKGKYTYKKIFKECHSRGEIDSSKPPVDPDSKTQAQWIRVFKKKDFELFGCAEEFEGLSDTDLDNLLAYLWTGAADSPTPAKCK